MSAPAGQTGSLDRVAAAGILAVVGGASLVLSLLLDWWDYPSAFAHPESLPDAVAFLAEGLRAHGNAALKTPRIGRLPAGNASSRPTIHDRRLSRREM